MNRRQKKKFKKKLGYKKYSNMRYQMINKVIENLSSDHPEFDCFYVVSSKNNKHMVHIHGLKLTPSIPPVSIKQDEPKTFNIDFRYYHPDNNKIERKSDLMKNLIDSWKSSIIPKDDIVNLQATLKEGNSDNNSEDEKLE